MSGYLAAAIAVAIWASYPVATRAGVTGAFAPHDLMALRFGVGAALFLPWLLLNFRALGREVWLRGIPLTLFQGAGMAALVICGLQFAPASHAAALGPGVSPAWVALLGFLLFARRSPVRMVIGAALCLLGVAALAGSSAAQLDAAVLAGDAMFLAASALGALYVLQLRRWGVGAVPGAAVVTLYSALIVLPVQLLSGSELLRIAPLELAWQALWQGVLIGCVALVALNHAIERLGSARSAALVALVPALSAVLGMLFLREVPSSVELAAIVAISAGVSLGASGGYAGSPAALSAAANRSA
jgi:drug/metabolite transporter (DMT)-like permease